MSKFLLKCLAGFFIVFLTPIWANKQRPMTELETATLAGGCFWCMQADFQTIKGVIEVISGYSGGTQNSANYEQVSSGTTEHVEAVQVTFNPKVISYEKLLFLFWQRIDPYDAKGQFCDKGKQYRSVIFFHNANQEQEAQDSLEQLQKLDTSRKVYTQIASFTSFYPAEAYHQNYHKKNPIRYKFYRYSCGRDSRLAKIWGES